MGNKRKLVDLSETKEKGRDAKKVRVEMKPGQTCVSSAKEAYIRRRKKTLFFSNLSTKAITSDFIDFFKDAGQVVRVQRLVNLKGNVRTDGFVEFASADEAEKALQKKHCRHLNGRQILLGVVTWSDTDFPPKNCRDHKFFSEDYLGGESLVQDKSKGDAKKAKARIEFLEFLGMKSGQTRSSVKDSPNLKLEENWAKLTEGCSFRKKNAFRSDSTYSSTGVTTRGVTAGLRGLLNLGNTCFMNSALQCLVHTPEFASYFQEDYHQDINRQNRLGMVGELALAFGDLLRKLWAPGSTPIEPGPFKEKLACFAPQFSGYNQHDSQELLAFLLDGLHEDLNRVKHKPCINSRDADGRPDEEVADEFWANQIARSDSIIVDVFQGQYKSTLVCTLCKKVSVTFDPFMHLSLPLQFNTTRAITVTVFSYDKPALPSTITVNVAEEGCCRDLTHALASACSLKPSEELKLAEIQNNLIHRLFEDPLIPLSTIKDDDHLAAYKLSKSSENTALLRLVIRRRDEKRKRGSTAQLKPYGTPLLSSASRENALTKGIIHCIVQNMLSPFRKEESVGKRGNSDVSIPGRSARFNNSEEEDKNGGLKKAKKSSSSEVGASKLSLLLVDENNKTVNLPDDESEAIKLPSSAMVTAYLDWTPELSGMYDITCLKSLPEVLKYGPATKKARSEQLSLYACLEAFLREEPLVRDEMWLCPRCNQKRQATKKLDLWRLPEVLVIHLKRFSNSSCMEKLETLVNFPMHDLDLTKYVANKTLSKPQLYELYALTNHYGGMGSGHYTAHIKHLDDNRWYNFDDNHISHINEDDVKSGAAYVLFYRRKSDASGKVENL